MTVLSSSSSSPLVFSCEFSSCAVNRNCQSLSVLNGGARDGGASQKNRLAIATHNRIHVIEESNGDFMIPDKTLPNPSAVACMVTVKGGGGGDENEEDHEWIVAASVNGEIRCIPVISSLDCQPTIIPPPTIASVSPLPSATTTTTTLVRPISTSISAMMMKPCNTMLVACAFDDKTIHIHYVNLLHNNHTTDGNTTTRLLQIIKSSNSFTNAMHLGYLPTSSSSSSSVPYLLTGSTDNHLKIFVYIKDEFKHTVTLPGHSDWIRSIAVATYSQPPSPITLSADNNNSNNSPSLTWNNGDLMIASASQDRFIRLWRLTYSGMNNNNSDDGSGRNKKTSEEGKEADDDDDGNNAVLNAFINGDFNESGAYSTTKLSTKAYIFHVPADTKSNDNNNNSYDDDDDRIHHRYTVMFDAMLYGHDDWVHSVSWAPPSKTTHHQPLLLVSASADKSIMLWAPDKETGIWTHVARMGDVGGSTLGFIAARFVGDSDSVAAIAYSGALHKWDKKTKKKKKKTVDSQIEEEEDEEAGGRVWIPQIGRGGHNRAVRDISWDPTGKYFVSVSIDETARLYAPWKKAVDGDGGGGKKSKEMWYEMARPQIHGYPLQCLAFVHGFGYVSGADEKILRMFEAPRTFVKSLEAISGISIPRQDLDSRPAGASQPALGLSNKAINPVSLSSSGGGGAHDLSSLSSYTDAISSASAITEHLVTPPLESHLVQNTLWPEAHKLYGHGYELMAVAATSTGDLLASASRATKPEHAVIRLWRTHSVNGSFLKHPKALYTLPITHALTVTALRFSHDDGMLLSVSRDRTWALYRRVEGGGGGGGVGGGGGDDDNGGSDSVNNNWELIKMHAKPHARIIWDCSWTSNDKFFATASRDKSVKIWRVDTLECCLTLSFEESVTAIDFAPRHAHERETEICVVGLETGRLMVCEVQLDIALISSSTKQPCSVIRQTVLELDECPSMSVTAIRWRPNSTSLEFVCCSEDHSVRLYSAK